MAYFSALQSNIAQLNAFQIIGSVITSSQPSAVPTLNWREDDYHAYRKQWELLLNLHKKPLTEKTVKEAVKIAQSINQNAELARQLKLAEFAIEQDLQNLTLLKSDILAAIASIAEQVKKDLQEAEKRRRMKNEIAMILLFA